MAATSRRFSTGLPFLDRRIDGGIEAGGLLALTAPPASQSELLLQEFLLANPTLYVTTTRPAEEVREWVTATADTDPDLTVVGLSGDEGLDRFEAVAAELVPESFLIVDTANPLETTSHEASLGFVNYPTLLGGWRLLVEGGACPWLGGLFRRGGFWPRSPGTPPAEP